MVLTLISLCDSKHSPRTAFQEFYQSKAPSQLRVDLEAAQSYQPAYGLLDFVGGASSSFGTTVQLYVQNVADRRAQLSRFAACSPTVCEQNYIIPAQPRTIGIKIGQKF